MAVFTVGVTIGSTGVFSTVAAWNSSLSGYDLVTLSNNPAYATSTAYTVGDLVVAGGNLYICSDAISNSTTTPTGTGTGITDNDGTWDYVCATAGNKLIYEGRLQQQAHTWWGTDVLGSGVTMDSEGYVLLTTVAGTSFRDYPNNDLKYDATYASVEVASHNNINITIPANAKARGVQFRQVGRSRGMIVDGTVYQCILKNDGTTDFSIVNNSSDGYFINCLIEAGVGATSSQGLVSAFGTIKMYYCTLVQPTDDPSSAPILFSTHTVQSNMRIFNCAFYGTTNALNKGGSGTITTTHFNHNASTDDGTSYPASADNYYNETYNATTPFEQAASASGLNFKAKSGTNLDATGTDVSGITEVISGDEDIFGNARDPSTPCIGCYEIQASGYSGDITQVLPFLSQAMSSTQHPLGAIDSTIPRLVQSIDASLIIVSNITNEFKPLTQLISATQHPIASIESNFFPLDQSMNSEFSIDISINNILASLDQLVNVGVLIDGSISNTLKNVTQLIEPGIQSDISTILANLQQTINVELGFSSLINSEFPAFQTQISAEEIIISSIASVLKSLDQSMSVALVHEGSASSTLPKLNQQILSEFKFVGTIEANLPSLAQNLNGTETIIINSINNNLPKLTQNANSEYAIFGTISNILASVQQSIMAEIEIQGTVIKFRPAVFKLYIK